MTEEAEAGLSVAGVALGLTAPTSELLVESGGRMPVETEDRADVPAGPATLLVGEGGRMGFGPDAEVTVAVMKVVDDEVRVIGQTVVETGTIIVLTGQSSMPEPHP